MKTPTANFTTEKNKVTGAAPRTLLEIDADGGTLYYSDQAVTVDAQPYTAIVTAWNPVRSQLVPGEEVVRTGGMSIELSNNPRIDDSIRAGLEVRFYIWFTGLATADKLLYFRGIINNDISGDIYKISFTCMDIGEYWDKKLGTTLSLADYSGADPDDVGKIIPWGYGPFYNQPCLMVDAGAVSTLSADYAGGGGTVSLTDANAPITFPSSGTFILGNETGTYTGKSGNDLTGVTGITKNYTRGDRVMENKASVKAIVRDHITKSLSNARILPNGKKLADAVTIPSGSVTYNTNDSGVSTITLTDLPAIRQEINIAVTQQQTQTSPLHNHTTSPTTSTYTFSAVPITPSSYGNKERLVDGGYVLEGYGQMYDNDKFRCTKTYQALSGIPVSIKIKMMAREAAAAVAKISMRFYWKGTLGKDEQVSLDNTLTTYTSTAYTLPGSPAWTDFQDAGTYIEVVRTDGIGGSIQIYFSEVWLEVTHDTPSNATAVTVSQALPTVVGGNSVADTLGGILICDGEGYADSEDIVVGTDTNDYKCILQHIASDATKPITGGSYTTYWAYTGGAGSGNTWVSGKNYAEDGHYTGVADTVITEPWEVIHHLLENRSNGITHSDIDLSGSFADVASNLSTYDWAFVCTEDGLYLNKLLALVGIQTWSRFVYEAGVAKLLRIKSTGGTGDKIININDGATSPLRDKRLQVAFKKPDLAQIYNNIEIKYNLNLTLGGWGTKEAYQSSSKSSNATSITNYLSRDRTWMMFAVGDNSTMANDLRDKLLDYWANPKPPYMFPAILTQAELERGDLIELTCSQLGFSGNLCEILETDYSPPMPINKQAPGFWFKVLYLLISNLRLTDTAQAGDALTKIDVNASLTDTAQAGDAVAIDITIPQLADGAAIGDALTLIKSLWFFDSTRYYDSTKQFNSAP